MREFDWYSNESRDTMRNWGEDVRIDLGRQIRDVQSGGFPAGAKWWKDVAPGVIQLKSKGFRTIITIAVEDVVVVVHAFEKDSAKGSGTRKQHKEIVRRRVSDLLERMGKQKRKH